MALKDVEAQILQTIEKENKRKVEQDIELSHSYVGELVLTLRSPTGELFSILDHDGGKD